MFKSKSVIDLPSCNFCSHSKLSTFFFICVLCDDFKLCANCEKFHTHPLLKVPSLLDLPNYLKILENKVIDRQRHFLLNQSFRRYEVQFKLFILEEVTVNSTFYLYVRLTNLSKNTIPAGMTLYCSENKEMDVIPRILFHSLARNFSLVTKLRCRANGQVENQRFTINLHNLNEDGGVHLSHRARVSVESSKGILSEDKISCLSVDKLDVLRIVIKSGKTGEDIEKIVEKCEELEWDRDKVETFYGIEREE